MFSLFILIIRVLVTNHEFCDTPEAYKFVTEVPSTSDATKHHALMLSERFLPGAEYKFVVRAKRVGGYGVGPPSPPLPYTIPCKSMYTYCEIYSIFSVTKGTICLLLYCK